MIRVQRRLGVETGRLLTADDFYKAARSLQAIRPCQAILDVEKVNQAEADFIEQMPVVSEAVRKAIVGTTLQRDFEGFWTRRFKAIVFTKDHGAYKFDTPDFIDRRVTVQNPNDTDKTTGELKIYFAKRMAALACQITSFVVLTSDGTCVARRVDNLWLQSGDYFYPSYEFTLSP